MKQNRDNVAEATAPEAWVWGMLRWLEDEIPAAMNNVLVLPPPGDAYDDEINVRGSSPHTSVCACSANRASCQLWTVTTPSTHAVDGQAAAIVAWTSKNAFGSLS